MERIVIIGAGVVGTATGKGLLRQGHAVEFVDIDRRRIDSLRSEGLVARDDVDLTGRSTLAFLTLPTPLKGSSRDLGALIAATISLGGALRDATERHVVVVRSTVPPGTSDDLVTPTLAECAGCCDGEGFTVASNPEFLRATCALDDFLSPRLTVIGSSCPRTVKSLVSLYRPFGGNLRTFDDTRTAERIRCAH